MAKKKWTHKEQEELCAKAKERFGPKFWCKPGYLFSQSQNAIFWTGEASYLKNGMPAYDYYDEDSGSYNFGTHVDLEAFALEHGVELENYDPGTLIGFPG